MKFHRKISTQNAFLSRFKMPTPTQKIAQISPMAVIFFDFFSKIFQVFAFFVLFINFDSLRISWKQILATKPLNLVFSEQNSSRVSENTRQNWGHCPKIACQTPISGFHYPFSCENLVWHHFPQF